MNRAALFVALILAALPVGAAVFCPTNATSGCGAFCPTQADCNAGWQWSSPNRAMVLYPVSLVRFSDGRLAVNQCTLDVVAYPPWSNPRDGQAVPACGGAYPPSVSLRVWCAAVKNLPLPAECSSSPCVRPNYVGVCGL
jgi:hypothetical protein